MSIKCLICNKERKERPSNIKRGMGKYCSRSCYYKSLIGNSNGFKKGHISYSPLEENSPQWKGNNIKYTALHQWVYRQLGQPEYCSNPACVYPRKDNRGKLMLKPKRYEWANKSRQYLRELSDWIRLCKSCHNNYDLGNLSI